MEVCGNCLLGVYSLILFLPASLVVLVALGFGVPWAWGLTRLCGLSKLNASTPLQAFEAARWSQAELVHWVAVKEPKLNYHVICGFPNAVT